MKIKTLKLKEYFPKMSEDSLHYYINLPIDHNDLTLGSFRGFYILNADFNIDKPIVFFLTDGQMDIVDTRPDFKFFNNILGGLSYILIGGRGQFRIPFLEVYNKNKTLNCARAVKYYASDQYIEDIETVRLDLKKKGILKPNKKICIFGASGAGVLAQQYISKYGRNVDKAILQTTGAPDIAKKENLTFSPNFADFNPEGAKLLKKATNRYKISLPKLSYVLYQVARSGKNPRETQIKILEKINNSRKSLYYFYTKYNLSLFKLSFNLPLSAASKVRWYELINNDFKNQPKEINLLFEFSKYLLDDFFRKEIKFKDFLINRSNFKGQVLVISGSEDVVFSIEIGKRISKEYKNSKFVSFNDNHRLEKRPRYYQNLRKTFFLYGLDNPRFKEILKNNTGLKN